MIVARGDFFADAVFWIALVSPTDQNHARARSWSQAISGRIMTTDAVLIETANALAIPAWRMRVIPFINHVRARRDVEVVHVDQELWNRSWEYFCSRIDKGWGFTDCISFVVMEDVGCIDALTADTHFVQAGKRALLLEDPG